LKQVILTPHTAGSVIDNVAHVAAHALGNIDAILNNRPVWCAAAGLPECTAHGLSKVIARRLAERGASAHEIAAVTGHRTLAEVPRYADKASGRPWERRQLRCSPERTGNRKCQTTPEGLTVPQISL
jgi:hypothetical protein